ncbi:MAG: Tfx family DNA-binding protein [Halobacteriota archaeon]|nr:Tfx family DNA-binding protein [Halobacteriota archaeon]
MAKSFLTEQQIEVLRLRELGLTQKEISGRLGTSRENVSIIEKRGRTNVERSIETLKEWELIKSPLIVVIEKGTDVLYVPKLIFDEADKKGIKVKSNLVEIITMIEVEKKELINNRTLNSDLEILVTNRGDIKIY